MKTSDMKRYILLLFITASSIVAHANYISDEVQRIMRTSQAMYPGLPRLTYLKEQVETHMYLPVISYLSKELYKEAKSANNITYINLGAYYIATSYDKKHDSDSLLIWVNVLKNYAPQIKNYDYYLEQKAAVGRALASKKQVEKSMFIAKEALKESLKRNCNNGIVGSYNSIGCCLSVASRMEESYENLLRGYAMLKPTTNPRLKADLLSRLVRACNMMPEHREHEMKYVEEMKTLMDTEIKERPETKKNWDDLYMDLYLKDVLRQKRKHDYRAAQELLDKSSELFGPHVDSVYWVNMTLTQLQLFGAMREYDKALKLVDEVSPYLQRQYISTYPTLIQFKGVLQLEKGDTLGAIATSKYLVYASDSLYNNFSQDQLRQIKELYHIDELEMEKQNIKKDMYKRAFVILLFLSIIIVGYIVYLRIIRARLKKIKDITTHTAQLSKESNLAKERLCMEISHDVRTPLNSVIGFAELLIESDDADKKTKEVYVNIIQDNASQLVEYVNSVLELSSLESGKKHYAKEVVDVIDVLQQEIIELNEMSDKKEIGNFRTDIKSAMITTDRKYLELLLKGLLDTPINVSTPVNIEAEYSMDKKSVRFVVKGSLFSMEDVEGQKVEIRDGINEHFVTHFGGEYKVDKIKHEVVIVYPLAEDKDAHRQTNRGQFL